LATELKSDKKNRNIFTTSVWVMSIQKMKNVRFAGRRRDASEFWHPSSILLFQCISQVTPLALCFY